jgi:ketosteroid isomerase-like protein
MFVDVLSPDAAVLTTTYRVPHQTPDGRPHVIGGAWTAVFARRDGRWQIVQEHLSDVPAAPAAEQPPPAPDTAHKHR